jgi:hypothetical protein
MIKDLISFNCFNNMILTAIMFWITLSLVNSLIRLIILTPMKWETYYLKNLIKIMMMKLICKNFNHYLQINNNLVSLLILQILKKIIINK